ncbi:unnamed protein product [Prorocentrum cordatum]|uniref:Uncharacterized protein n=1 Tax=Prorocentrum cordatum TaxID=2364126 RepID=A0ABN9R9B8_9DINO|nr:unnamed protein product [Polarella glacialis]
MEAAPQNYSEEGTRRTAFTSMCALWFVLGSCVLLVRMARQARRASVASYLGQLAGLCRGAVRLLAGSAGGPAAKQVAQELQKRRLVRAHASLPYVCAAIQGVLTLGLVRSAHVASRPNSVVQDICLMVCSYIFLFLWAFPQSLTSRTLDAWSCLVVAVLVLYVSPFASEEAFAASSSLLPFAATLVMCSFNMNGRLNFIWLLAVSLSICSTIYFGFESPLRNEDCLPPRAQRASQVLTATCVFAIVIAFFHTSVYRVVQYDIEANISRNELKAARSVLRSVCDAVVELDSDFRLQDGSSELVDMLLLNPLRNFIGEDLRQFLASQQDREKFSAQMRKAGLLSEDAVGLSAAFHVAMKDSSSIPLDVEVFCVSFVNREGRAAYFVGIREFTDTAPMLRGSAPETTRRGGRRAGPRNACTARLSPLAALADPTAALSGQASSDTLSEASSPHGSWEDLGAEAELVAWVDVLTPGYSVRLETPAFAQYVDAPGELLAAVRRSQHEELITWVQEAYLALLQEGADPAPREYHRRLHLRSPAQQRGAHGSRGPRPMLSALLRLDLALPSDGQDHGRGVVRIVLWDLLRGRRGRRGARKLSSCGTPPAIARAASGQLLAQEQLSRAASLAGGAARPDAAGGQEHLEDPSSPPPGGGPAARPLQVMELGRGFRSL